MILSYCRLMSHISLQLKPSLTVWGLCRYHFSDFSRFNFSHNFQWTILATLSYLLIYSLWASFEHSVMIWLIVLSATPHILQKGESTLCQYGIWHSLFLLLVLVQSIPGPHLVFLITFSQPELGLFFVWAFRHISNNCPDIYFSFQFYTHFSFGDFLKVFLWDALSELQNPDMLYFLKQIFIRILKVPPKVIFFTSNCTFATHQSFSFLFSTKVKSVYITFWVDFFMHCESSYLTLLVRQISIVALQHHISLLLQPRCLSLLFYSFHLT